MGYVSVSIHSCSCVSPSSTSHESKDKISRNISHTITGTIFSEFIHTRYSFSSFQRIINKALMKKWNSRWLWRVLGNNMHNYSSDIVFIEGGTLANRAYSSVRDSLRNSSAQRSVSMRILEILILVPICSSNHVRTLVQKFWYSIPLLFAPSTVMPSSLCIYWIFIAKKSTSDTVWCISDISIKNETKKIKTLRFMGGIWNVFYLRSKSSQNEE